MNIDLLFSFIACSRRFFSLSKTLTFIFLSLCVSVAFSQSVDLLTGRLQYSIPLGQLSANDISVGLNIYNNGGPMRLYEGEEDCGMGWSLNANNFAVVREVRGLPDWINTDTKKGWLFNSNAQSVQNLNPGADDNLATYQDESADWTAINNLVGTYTNDSEPDLFYVNAPGVNLQFLLDGSGNPRLLNHADVKIEFLPSALDPNAIVVKTNTGIIYRFGRVDQVTRRGSAKDASKLNTKHRYYRGVTVQLETTWTSAWRLTSMESIITGTKASFSYYPGPEESFIYQSVASREHYLIDSASVLTDVHYRLLLKEITLNSYRAVFTWSNRLLSGVKIEETTSGDKRGVELNYSASIQYDRFHYVKNFLKKVGFVGNRCDPSEAYEFEYLKETDLKLSNGFQTFLNWKDNHGLDYFGYANAQTSNKNKPTLYFYASESDGRRLRVTPIPGNSTPPSVVGHNRTPNSAVAAYGALTKVILPTGGFISFEWEPNTYMDNSTNEQLGGVGLRVKKITSQGGEAAFGKSLTDYSSYRAQTKEYEYTQSGNSLSSGILTAPIKLGFVTSSGIESVVHNLGEEPEILYSRVKEIVSGQGSTVYEYGVPGAFPETSNGEWKATKSRIARSGNTPVGSIKNGYYTFPYARSSNYSFKRGQLLRVSEYAQTGTLVREKLFTYVPKSTNPTIIKGLRFEKVNDIYHYGIYELLVGRMEVISQEVVRESSKENPSNWFQTTTNYTYNANHMLQMATTTMPDGTVKKNQYKYATDFQLATPASTDTAAVAIKALNDAFRGSTLIEQVSKVTLPGLTEKVEGAQLILYRVFENGQILPYYSKVIPTGATFTDATVTGNNFVADTAYRTIQTFKEYDNNGRLLTSVDNNRNYLAQHYALDPAYSIATFQNIKARQAMYEGFELASSFGLSIFGANYEYANGWTGNKAITLTDASTVLRSPSSGLIERNGTKYRVSCWVKSATGSSVIFQLKDGNTPLGAPLNLNNTVTNKWNYLEGEITVNNPPVAFSLEVSTNSGNVPVTLDDIVFVPVHARVAMQTKMPLTGTTSQTDDQGNSVKFTHDNFGRVVNTLDRNRNLVQRNEYRFKNLKVPVPTAAFQGNTELYYVGTPATFTPYDGSICDPQLTYAWEVDGAGIASGPNNTLIHTFTTVGQHTVKLTVTNSSGLSETAYLSICVQYIINGTFSAQVLDSNGNPISTYDCTFLGSFAPHLILPEGFPPQCLGTIGWATTTSPSGNGGTIFTYSGIVLVDCDFMKSCTASQASQQTFNVSCSITWMPNPNCP